MKPIALCSRQHRHSEDGMVDRFIGAESSVLGHYKTLTNATRRG
jgi:hypothetical protein